MPFEILIMPFEIHILWMLFALGLGLLACEIFIPGGIVGVAGFILVIGAIGTSIYQDSNLSALFMFLIAVVAIPAGIMFALPRFALNEELSSEGGFIEGGNNDLLGQVGRAISPLRPSGTAEFDGGRRISVVSEVGMIDADEEVTVIRVEGNRIFVRAVES